MVPSARTSSAGHSQPPGFRAPGVLGAVQRIRAGRPDLPDLRGGGATGARDQPRPRRLPRGGHRGQRARRRASGAARPLPSEVVGLRLAPHSWRGLLPPGPPVAADGSRETSSSTTPTGLTCSVSVPRCVSCSSTFPSNASRVTAIGRPHDADPRARRRDGRAGGQRAAAAESACASWSSLSLQPAIASGGRGARSGERSPRRARRHWARDGGRRGEGVHRSTPRRLDPRRGHGGGLGRSLGSSSGPTVRRQQDRSAATSWSSACDGASLDLRDPSKASCRISDISYRWGFASQAHFATSFKKRYGCSPSEFRAGDRQPPTRLTPAVDARPGITHRQGG